MGKGDRKTRKGKRFRKSYGVCRKHKKKNMKPNSKNLLCYMSKDKLTKDNMSLEHVIPNGLGGKLKSYHLINAEWNDNFGRTIDAVLVKQIPLPTIFNINRDRKKNPKVRAKTEDGTKYLVDKNLQAKRRPTKPEETILEDGRISLKFIDGQEKDVLKNLKKKYPKADIEQLRKQIIWDETPRERLMFFENNLNLITGVDAARAISKIATSFYVLSAKEISNIQQVVPFLRGEDDGIGVMRYYYPEDKLIHQLKEDEISHLIYIKGDAKEKLLYAYVELFNCHNFLIVLNNSYEGKDVEYSYCYDLNTNTKLEKKVNLDLTKEEIDSLAFPGEPDTESKYFEKLERIMNIRGLKLERRNVKDLKS